MKILVADDSATIRRVLDDRLADWGYDPVLVENGAEALQALQSPDGPRIAILDWIMPEMDGPTVCRHLRRDTQNPYVYIIILTSNKDPDAPTEALEAEADDFLTKPFNEKELRQRIRAGERVLRLERQVGTMKNSLEFEATHDSLTGVLNKAAILGEVQNAFGLSCESEVSLLTICLDNHKTISDSYGHRVADEALAGVAQRVKAMLRSQDSLGRFDGAEFLILLNSADDAQVSAIAERIRDCVSSLLIVVNGTPIKITLSIGIAKSAATEGNAESLISSARFALTQARNRGGNCISHGPDQTGSLESAKVLIVDDEPTIAEVVKRHLVRAGCQNILSTTDPTRTMDLIQREKPDLVLLDVHMPVLNGMDVLRLIRGAPELQRFPVIILTADTRADTKLQALREGASDFLAKPVDPSELILRMRNTLDAKAFQDNLCEYTSRLEKLVQERTAELDASRRQVILCLAKAAEYNDDDTGNHVARVGKYAGIIASELGFSKERIDLLEQAALLHDVGKIGIPDSVLKKPGRLDEDEFELIRIHSSKGKDILEPAPRDDVNLEVRKHTQLGATMVNSTDVPVLKLASIIALTHHERWDGSGYPLGLAGEDIPVEARITAVADVYDALSTKRPYKPAFPREKCFKILHEGRGTHFDPRVLDAFFARAKDVIQVQIELSDSVARPAPLPLSPSQPFEPVHSS